VIANNDFARELGARLMLNRQENDKFVRPGGKDVFLAANPNVDALVDLATTGAAGPGGALGFTLIKAGGYILDLELSAAQRENRAEIVSNPRLVTADQTKATIKQGEEIPYQATVAVGGGASSNIQFKQAVLELNVTPHITPDDQVLMELLVKKDARGQQAAGGNPAIDKREIETTALVANGETVVLGGVYEATRQNSSDKVPFLGDLPVIGTVFRRNNVIDNKRELLIFITPKILKQYLGTP
jgi:type IV pilus assembly protein PilQ